MANRTRIALTTTLTKIASKKCVITVTEADAGSKIILNSTSSLTAALVDVAKVGNQIVQNETADTWAKCEDGEVVVIVDEVA